MEIFEYRNGQLTIDLYSIQDDFGFYDSALGTDNQWLISYHYYGVDTKLDYISCILEIPSSSDVEGHILMEPIH